MSDVYTLFVGYILKFFCNRHMLFLFKNRVHFIKANYKVLPWNKWENIADSDPPNFPTLLCIWNHLCNSGTVSTLCAYTSNPDRATFSIALRSPRKSGVRHSTRIFGFLGWKRDKYQTEEKSWHNCCSKQKSPVLIQYQFQYGKL